MRHGAYSFGISKALRIDFVGGFPKLVFIQCLIRPTGRAFPFEKMRSLKKLRSSRDTLPAQPPLGPEESTDRPRKAARRSGGTGAGRSSKRRRGWEEVLKEAAAWELAGTGATSVRRLCAYAVAHVCACVGVFVAGKATALVASNRNSASPSNANEGVDAAAETKKTGGISATSSTTTTASISRSSCHASTLLCLHWCMHSFTAHFVKPPKLNGLLDSRCTCTNKNKVPAGR